jgi:hypothetical protein
VDWKLPLEDPFEELSYQLEMKIQGFPEIIEAGFQYK